MKEGYTELGRVVGAAESAKGMLRHVETVGLDLVICGKKPEGDSPEVKAAKAKAKKVANDKFVAAKEVLRSKVTAQKKVTRKDLTDANLKILNSLRNDLDILEAKSFKDYL